MNLSLDECERRMYGILRRFILASASCGAIPCFHKRSACEASRAVSGGDATSSQSSGRILVRTRTYIALAFERQLNTKSPHSTGKKSTARGELVIESKRRIVWDKISI
jgi:hypothetical protein